MVIENVQLEFIRHPGWLATKLSTLEEYCYMQQTEMTKHFPFDGAKYMSTRHL